MKKFNFDKEKLLALYETHKMKLPFVLIAIFGLSFYGVSKHKEANIKRYVYKSETKDYSGGKIFNSANSNTIHKGKERSWNKKVSKIKDEQQKINETIRRLTSKIQNFEEKNKKLEEELEEKRLKEENDKSKEKDSLAKAKTPTILQDQVNVVSSAVQHHAKQKPDSSIYRENKRTRRKKVARKKRTLITFPVKDKRKRTELGIMLPTGSYVKAKLLTGIEAPEGKTYPVLAQLEYAYVTPNDNNGEKRIDLSGCFMILKAQGDLSTERVQMQADKLSCVSKSGKMFEKSVNGFIADQKDSSFGVIGTVNSKQDRVALFAFVSSVVEGISKAVQQAQTTQSTTALGGSQTVLSGDQKKYIVAGGLGNAAGRVTDWYLRQAENLLPTINIGSGQDVFIVMGSSTNLPHEYFKKSRRNEDESIYNFYTNFIN